MLRSAGRDRCTADQAGNAIFDILKVGDKQKGGGYDTRTMKPMWPRLAASGRAFHALVEAARAHDVAGNYPNQYREEER